MKIMQEATRIWRNIGTVQTKIDDMSDYIEELRDKNCPEDVKLFILLETLGYIKKLLDEIKE